MLYMLDRVDLIILFDIILFVAQLFNIVFMDFIECFVPKTPQQETAQRKKDLIYDKLDSKRGEAQQKKYKLFLHMPFYLNIAIILALWYDQQQEVYTIIWFQFFCTLPFFLSSFIPSRPL